MVAVIVVVKVGVPKVVQPHTVAIVPIPITITTVTVAVVVIVVVAIATAVPREYRWRGKTNDTNRCRTT